MASSGRDFDPRTRAFSDEELKPQPMIKKSRKQVSFYRRYLFRCSYHRLRNVKFIECRDKVEFATLLAT